MAFVTTLHLQASADAAFSCKPVWPVTRGGCGLRSGVPMGIHVAKKKNHVDNKLGIPKIVPPCHDAGPLWRSWVRGCGVCGPI